MRTKIPSMCMDALFHRRFNFFVNPAAFAALICFCMGVAPHCASAQPIIYMFDEYSPGNYAYPVTGDVVVNSGTLVGGELSFSGYPAVPFSSWYEPSWNGSYLTAGISGTGLGTVLATGPGQPAVQIFEYLNENGYVVEGTWVPEVPEPSVASILFMALPGLGVVARRFKRVSA